MARRPAAATRRKCTARSRARAAATSAIGRPRRTRGKARARSQRTRAPATVLPTANRPARAAVRAQAGAVSAAGLEAFRSTRPKAAPPLGLRRISLPAKLTRAEPRDHAAIHALKANPACDRAQLI